MYFMERLIRLMNAKIEAERSPGKSKLALAIGRSDRMVDRFRKRESTPTPDQAYKLALACGCSAEEALAIKLECSSDRPRRTA